MFSFSDVYCVPLSRESRYTVVIREKLSQEQDSYIRCHMQAGNQMTDFCS